jgi:hypothetical protein
MSRNSTVGRSGFDSRQGLGTFISATVSRPALGPTKPRIQWVKVDIFPGVKRPGREADKSAPYSTELKNAWRYTSTPHYVFIA